MYPNQSMHSKFREWKNLLIPCFIDMLPVAESYGRLDIVCQTFFRKKVSWSCPKAEAKHSAGKMV